MLLSTSFSESRRALRLSLFQIERGLKIKNGAVKSTLSQAAIGAALKGIGAEMSLTYSTTYPTLISTSDIDIQEIDLSSYGSKSKKIFCNSSFSYVPPSTFKYQLPNGLRPEVAFIGRSNVGKSSLVDILTGSKGIVRISKTPGCTKTINFFAITPHSSLGKISEDMNIPLDKHHAYLVDMPGYGFAKASKEDKARWSGVLQSYLMNRAQSVLRRVFLLVDIRHGLKPSDIEMMYMLNVAKIPYQLVFTKSDLAKSSDIHDNIKAAFGMVRKIPGGTCMPLAHIVSSTTGSGIDTLKLSIVEIFAQNWSNQESDEVFSE